MSKATYNSDYTSKKVTASQYIAEKMCERYAKSKGTKLPSNFWYIKEWMTYFKYQTLLANKLIKMYGAEAVIQTISDKKLNWVYSLKYPGISKQAEILSNKLKNFENEEKLVDEPKVSIRKEESKKSLLDLI